MENSQDPPCGTTIRLVTTRELSESERRNVQTRLIRHLQDVPEVRVRKDSGIPQSTLNALKNDAKCGFNTARRLAAYFGESVEDLIAGREPGGAPEFAAREKMHPSRGAVLDRLRGVVAREVLEEVASLELPEGAPPWSELDWLREVVDRAERRRRMGK